MSVWTVGLAHLIVRNIIFSLHRNNTLSRVSIGNDHFLFETEEDGVHDTERHAATQGNSSVGNDFLKHTPGRKNEATLKKKEWRKKRSNNRTSAEISQERARIKRERNRKKNIQ
jgi:hypothetical protein